MDCINKILAEKKIMEINKSEICNFVFPHKYRHIQPTSSDGDYNEFEHMYRQ